MVSVSAYFILTSLVQHTVCLECAHIGDGQSVARSGTRFCGLAVLALGLLAGLALVVIF